MVEDDEDVVVPPFGQGVAEPDVLLGMPQDPSVARGEKKAPILFKLAILEPLGDKVSGGIAFALAFENIPAGYVTPRSVAPNFEHQRQHFSGGFVIVSFKIFIFKKNRMEK